MEEKVIKLKENSKARAKSGKKLVYPLVPIAIGSAISAASGSKKSLRHCPATSFRSTALAKAAVVAILINLCLRAFGEYSPVPPRAPIFILAPPTLHPGRHYLSDYKISQTKCHKQFDTVFQRSFQCFFRWCAQLCSLCCTLKPSIWRTLIGC